LLVLSQDYEFDEVKQVKASKQLSKQLDKS